LGRFKSDLVVERALVLIIQERNLLGGGRLLGKVIDLINSHERDDQEDEADGDEGNFHGIIVL
jgi:hypothetical protein